MNEHENIILKHPDKIPIKLNLDTNIKVPKDFKKKFLVHKNITGAQFLFNVRKKLEIGPTEGLFLMQDNHNIASNQTVEEIDLSKKEHSNILELNLKKENIFG